MRLEKLTTKFLGKKLKYFDNIDSTQLEIFRDIDSKTIENGEIVLADIQTQGMRNTWKKVVYRCRK